MLRHCRNGPLLFMQLLISTMQWPEPFNNLTPPSGGMILSNMHSSPIFISYVRDAWFHLLTSWALHTPMNSVYSLATLVLYTSMKNLITPTYARSFTSSFCIQNISTHWHATVQMLALQVLEQRTISGRFSRQRVWDAPLTGWLSLPPIACRLCPRTRSCIPCTGTSDTSYLQGDTFILLCALGI